MKRLEKEFNLNILPLVFLVGFASPAIIFPIKNYNRAADLLESGKTKQESREIILKENIRDYGDETFIMNGQLMNMFGKPGEYIAYWIK